MTDKLYVHVDLGNGDIVLCGQLIIDRLNRSGRFKYSKQYCENKNAYSLDPINLPLIAGAVYESPMTRDHMGIAGALLDAGPDDWGKKLLIALLDPPPSNSLEFLLAGSGQGTGTIYFSQDKDNPIGQALPREFGDIDEVLETALLLDEGLEVSREKAMFFRYGSSIGGVRPKTFVDERVLNEKTGEISWTRWIVKFPKKGELVDNCLLEFASMQMAESAGIRVPRTKVLQTAMGAVLLVERFDIDELNQRSHVISAQSLINTFDASKMNPENVSYANIGRIAKQISEEGTLDNSEMFRRMIFNIAIGNVDDHPYNHSFYKHPNKKHLRLTPAYDVLPTVGMQGSIQSIAVGPMGGRQSVDNITLCASEMGIDPEEAHAIVSDVLDATADWESQMMGVGLSIKEVSIVGKCFHNRQAVINYMQSLPVKERERAEKETLGYSITR